MMRLCEFSSATTLAQDRARATGQNAMDLTSTFLCGTAVMPKIIAIIIIVVCLSFAPAPGAATSITINGHNLAITTGAITQQPDAVTLIQGEALGLAAHSHLAGAEFYAIQVGDTVLVSHENGYVRYRIVDVVRFTALEPLNQYGEFVDMYGHTYTSHQVYIMTYGVPDRLVLQTCADGARDRMFWIGVIND